MADAPSRYDNVAVIGNGTQLYLGRRTMENTLPRGDDRFVTTLLVDNLHLVAFRYLGDQRLWWVVADFNAIIDPTVELAPYTTLRLPSTTRLWLDVLR
jgi:hypothetical protein